MYPKLIDGLQYTTFMTSQSHLMATARVPSPTWTRSFAARFHPATRLAPRHAKLATSQASTATSQPLHSRLRELCRTNIFPSPADYLTISYLDLYASTKSGIGAFLGNRSINIHTNNATRLTCANFTLTAGSGSNTTASSPTGVAPPKTAFTGAAATTLVSLGAVAAGLLALFL
jgi:hypothetical protein